MKKLFLPLAFVAVMGMQAQTTIVEEKFEKDNEPLDYNFLPKGNKLVIQKGKVPNMIQYKKIQSLNEYTSTAEKNILLDNAEIMECSFSQTENGFHAKNYSSVTIGHKVKFYLNNKSSDSYDFGKARKYKFSDHYGFYLSDKNGSVADKLDGKDIILNRIDTRSLKESDISIELPSLNRLQGDNLLKQVVGSRTVIKGYGIGYKLNVIDNEKFEIITKGIDKEYKSMTLYRTIYNNDGKLVEDLKYTIDLKGMYLVNSANNGGEILIHGGNGSLSFGDDLSINNFIIDKNTKDIYVYGLFGKQSEKSPSGYYIFKFSDKGEKLYESINYINDKAFQDEAYKVHLYTSSTIIGNKLLFVAGRTKVLNKKYFNYNYGLIDIVTGKELNSKFIEYETNYKGYSPSNFVDTWHTNKQLNNKALDMNTYILYDFNPAIKKNINSVTSKEKVSFNCEISQEGIWLIESDNKEYYKVTYFENN
jgi:hypothetical protein